MKLLLVNNCPRNLVIGLVLTLSIGCCTQSGPDEIDDTRGTFDQNPTYKLRLHNGLLYAGTEGGLFRKPVDPSATEWESLGLGNATIYTFLIFSKKELLASVNYQGHSQNTIAKTTNGGQAWVKFRNGYGRGINNRVPRAMAMHPSNSDVLLAGGPGGPDIAKSINKGKDWKLISGTWENLGFLYFLKMNEQNPQILWSGGTNAIFQPYLIKSENGGKTWMNLSKNLQIIDNTIFEANANDIIIDPQQSSKVLLGLSVGIFRSTNEGVSWDSTYTEASIKTFTIRTDNPKQIYASGQNAVGSLFFIQSNDFGNTWQQVTVPSTPKNIVVNDMVSVMIDGREVLYFATNKGVYSYIFEE